MTLLFAAGATGEAAAQPGLINAATAPLGIDEDDDDYEPDLTPAEDTEQILNKLDNAPPEEPIEPAADAGTAMTLGPFKLPPPPTVDPEVATKLSQAAASRVFGPLSALKDAGVGRRPKAGINRLAASSYDRDSWLTLITRLATRSTAGLEDTSVGIKSEAALDRPLGSRMSLGDSIREMLYAYVLEDWRRRIEIAVAWLCEEWYNDQLTKRRKGESEVNPAELHYERWALRLVDGFLSYVTAQDKVLTRFLAEIPGLSRPLLGKLKTLCADPATVQLALTSLLYLVMMRPPAREMALDTVAEIWAECECFFFTLLFAPFSSFFFILTSLNPSVVVSCPLKLLTDPFIICVDEDARPLAAKYLVKWRPGFIESQTRSTGGDAAQANNMAIAT